MGDPRRKFTIGRDRGCDIPLADDSVSGRHAELSFIGDGKLLLTDCKSTNGCFLLQSNGREQRLRQDLVSPLDRIRFGSVVLSMRELLESLRLKYPRFEEEMRAPVSPDLDPWERGKGLIRCAACGAPHQGGKPCPVCIP